MTKIPGHCDRCGQPGNGHRMSWFNTEMICAPCQVEEAQHPQYAEAKRIENEEVRKGNTKFPGIGLPDDLKLKYQK